MNYKYQKWQIFGKRLKVPKDILNKVYSNTLSFTEFLNYQLDDKIPISCIERRDRELVERFGIDKCRELDWALMNEMDNGLPNNFSLSREMLMSIDPQTQDINKALYEKVIETQAPSNYPPKIREMYLNELVSSVSENNNKNVREIMSNFIDGKLDIKEIIRNWSLFKDKNLVYCLANDSNNKNKIRDEEFKKFMTDYGELASLIVENDDIYSFMNVLNIKSGNERREFIKPFTDNILKHYSSSDTKLTDSQYKELFKYSSLSDYLRETNANYSSNLIEELETLPQDYISHMPIPISVLSNSNVLQFINHYGLKNIIDFDNECENFFTKNDCEVLKKMGNKYFSDINFERMMRLQSLQSTDNTTTTEIYDKNENSRKYTKEEFYEKMKQQMIKNNTGDLGFKTLSLYEENWIDFSKIGGKFRSKYPELFISDQAPKELKTLFYSKSLTFEILSDHPEYIEFLNGKDMSYCLKSKGAENLYELISSKLNFKDTMDLFTIYSDVLGIIFPFTDFSFEDRIDFSIDDDINQILNKIDETLIKIIVETRSVYPKRIPQRILEKYPNMFLDRNAPRELQIAFYNRKISKYTNLILSNPIYKQFLENKELRVMFKHMPVIDVTNNQKNQEINLVEGIIQVFGEKDALDVMLSYGIYLEYIYEINRLRNFKFNLKFSKDDLLNEIDKVIYQEIIKGNIRYNENIHNHFKNNNPTLFLNENVPQVIKNKFYNRKFTIEDFNNNPNLLEIFDKTNIACGFSKDMIWCIPLFNDYSDLKLANRDRLKVILEYSKIQDKEVENSFVEYINERTNDINIENIEDWC